MRFHVNFMVSGWSIKGGYVRGCHIFGEMTESDCKISKFP